MHMTPDAPFRTVAYFSMEVGSAIALNGSFFNTQRMVSQYITNAYFFLKGNCLK